jgi:hypothetical protein
MQEGLNNRSTDKYITIFDGKFTLRVPDGTPGAISRENKIGKVVHELSFDSFTGKLIDIATKDSTAYGTSWLFTFVAGGEKYVWQTPYSNSFSTAFLKQLPNADLSKVMRLTPSTKIGDDGKTKSSLFVEQDGVTLKHAYSKENPNGLPDMVQIKVKGQLQWDDSDRVAFLHNMVETQIMPKLKEMYGDVSSSSPSKEVTLDDIEPLNEDPF